MNQQRSLEQERAKDAWKAIEAAKTHNKEYQGKYKSVARSASADIQINGLGQTLAFWRAKETHQKDLYKVVSAWVKSRIKWEGNDHLLLWITNTANTEDYRRATSEALAYLNWVKRFAEAELEAE